jgi:CotH kinase protein
MKILFYLVLLLSGPYGSYAGNSAPPVTLSSSNLPIIVINTNGQTIPNEPKISADMGIVFNSGSARNNINDVFNHYNGKIGIEIRGQSSQSFPMKSYSIELRDNTGASQDKSLFGLPKESDWVLYAPYTDKTLMRNFLAYTFSREMGRWAANCRFVEVVLNGDYIGIYVFMERIKRGSGRVNIPKMAATDIAGDEVTGGYIFSLDKEPNGWYSSYISPNSANAVKPQFSFVYPKIENIVAEQKEYLKKRVDSFERTLSSPQFQDPNTGFRKYIDVPSFIDFSIINEVSKNVDGYRLSSYFYKDKDSKGGKIVAGPVWDYDLAFRNANYCNGSLPGGWGYDFNYVCPSDPAALVPFWWGRFQQDTAYQAGLRCRWKQVRQTSISLSRINQLIDSVVALTTEARERHFVRWPVLGVAIWPNPTPVPTSYSEEITVLKNWINNRLTWIDANIANRGACYDFPAIETKSLLVKLVSNPVNSNAHLSIQSRNNQKVAFRLIAMNGQLLWTSEQDIPAGTSQLKIPTHLKGAGVYLLKIVSATGEKTTIKLLQVH